MPAFSFGETPDALRTGKLAYRDAFLVSLPVANIALTRGLQIPG